MNKLFASVLLCAALLGSGILRADNIVISNRKSSILITAQKGESPRIQYFGPRLANPGDVFDSGSAFNDPVYPQFGVQCSRETAIQATHNDGNMSLELVVESVTRENRDGGQVTAIATRDKFYPFYVTIYYKTYPDCEVIETWTEIRHLEKKPVTLYRFASAFLPVRRGDNWLSHFHGPWGAEAYLYEEVLRDGMRVIKDKDGVRNTQNSCPSFMLTLDGRPDEQHGMVIGGTLAWSGNYRIAIDNDNAHTTRIFAGINEDQSQYILEPKEVFTTPVFAFTFSDEGKGGVSRNFHRWARLHRLNHGGEQRSILLNSWEGVSMNVNQEVMDQMMADFAAMGGEMFVMDDGWFGDKYPRNNGTSSLGDWVVCKEKLPEGIEGLTASAREKGLKFGIWIEPEMTNSKSELFEKHPEWVIQQPHREMHKGRGGTQLVLDLSNPEVQEFVFGVVDKLMTAHPEIAYIKWDANMTLFNYGSTYLPRDKQSHLYIAYHRGLENILKRIHAKYPGLVMQACASGGGRINYGLLPYYDEFWTSDNTDALQRIFIQWGVSNFFPAVAMASHVSVDTNYQTGRKTPLKLRFDVAMSGRMGMELQPAHMTDEDKAFARRAIADYKLIRPVVQQGDLYRLISPFDKTGYASLMYVSPEKDHAAYFVYKLEQYHNMPRPAFRMAGLDPQKRYLVRELSLDGKPIPLNNPRKCLDEQLAFVSEDRRGVGLLLDETLEWNVAFPAMQIQNKFLKKYGPITWRDTKAIHDVTQEYIDELKIKCTSSKQKARELSGGNQQKVCLAKAFALQPRFLFVSEPTRGIDVGAKALVLDALKKFNRENGVTVVMISSELEELRTTCDRIAIVSGGRIVGILPATESSETFGALMVSQVK